MEIEAIQLGEGINVKELIKKHKTEGKDPLVLLYSKTSKVVVLKYGAVVLWNFKEKERNDFIKKLGEYIYNPLEKPCTEKIIWKKGEKTSISNGIIQTKPLTPILIQLISVSLARTVALDLLEQKVNILFEKFNETLEYLEKNGKIKSSGKSLLKLTSAAIAISHKTVNQMAMMDKPDLTWDDIESDEMFTALEEEYELSDRWSILNKKLNILKQDSVFTMDVINNKQSHFLELIIVMLFIIDIILILFKIT